MKRKPWNTWLEAGAETLRPLGALWRMHPRLLSLLVVLGIIGAFAEGFGITLFIPLLQSVVQPDAVPATGQTFVDVLGRLFAGVPQEHRLLVVSGAILGTIFFRVTLSYVNGALSGWVSSRISHELRTGVFDRLLRVGYGFIERSDHGRLVNTLATETWRATDSLSTLVSLIISACTALVFIGLLLLISWQLTLVVAVAVLFIAWVSRMLTRRVRALGRLATRSNAVMARRMLEGLSGMKTIRICGRETYEQGRFEEASDRVRRVFWRLGLISGVVGPVYETLAAVLLVAVLFVSLQDPQNLPAVLVFIFILYRLLPKVRSLDSLWLRLTELAPAVREVETLRSPAGKPHIHSGPVPFERVRDSITMEGVSFAYGEKEDWALEGVSLEIPAGKTTALVGASGGGKSTLVKLLFRFYDPTEGSIRVDGRPLTDFDLAAWRERIGVVSQDVHLFNAPVWENIAYGRPGATRAEVEEAARQADADAFIRRLPMGYDTIVGDRGLRLSGGQRQRITLARAIVRDPDLLILDEATNALDALSEQVIQEALEAFSKGRTAVVIAHRLSTIEQADQIVVMEGGRIAEVGTLDELLRLDGLFARLYRIQHRTALPHELPN